MSFKYPYLVASGQEFSIISFPEQAAVYELVKSLPDDSIVVEVGTALGGTACLMAAANPKLNINCVDCFSNNFVSDIWGRIHLYGPVRDLGIELDVEASINKINNFFADDPTGQLAFEYITKPYPNITLHKGHSPRDFNNWDKMIDVYMEDAFHENPTLSDNVDFWKNFVRPGGYIIGHDYYAELYPDVVDKFNELILQGWVKISLTENLIILQKPLN
jgi:hypothetical protein